MILYFSATGTNKYVAEEIAKATGEKIVPLKELVRQEKYSLTVPEGEIFGVVMPTYWEGLPAILLDYLTKAEIHLEGSNQPLLLLCGHLRLRLRQYFIHGAKGIRQGGDFLRQLVCGAFCR